MMVRKQIYLTDSEVNSLAELSEVLGISTSEYIRRVLDGYLQKDRKPLSKAAKSGSKMLRKQIYLTRNEVELIDSKVATLNSSGSKKISSSEYIRRIIDEHIEKANK